MILRIKIRETKKCFLKINDVKKINWYKMGFSLVISESLIMMFRKRLGI